MTEPVAQTTTIPGVPPSAPAASASTSAAPSVPPAEPRKRKQRSDKGKPKGVRKARAPKAAAKAGIVKAAKAGNVGKPAAKAKAKKAGKECQTLAYQLAAPAKPGLDYVWSAEYPLKSTRMQTAVSEVLGLSRLPENAATHPGCRCRIIALKDEFTIASEIKTQVKAVR